MRGHRESVALACAVVVMSGVSATAQLLPPVPPRPEPTAEYVPPAAKPAPPKEPEIAAPVLVVRDAAGKLRTYDLPLDEVAVGLMTLPEESRAKVEKSLAARRAEIERFVADNPEKIRAATSARPKVENIADFNELFAAREAAQPLMQERLSERLLRDGAITPLQRVRLDEGVQAYEAARREEWKETTGSDAMKIAGLVGRQAFIESTREAMSAFDRLIERTAPTIAADVALLLREEQSGALDELRKSETTPARARVFVLETLDAEQQRALLRKHVIGAGDAEAGEGKDANEAARPG